MSFTKLPGAEYQSEQLQVYDCTATGTIPADADQVNVTVTSLTVTLPLDPKLGKKIIVCGVGFAVTVAANTGQSIGASASANAVTSGTSRAYVATQIVSDVLIWAPAAIA